MKDQFELSAAAAQFIRSQTPVAPAVALVLGSGLGDYADSLESPTVIPFREIPGFATSSVSGHASNLVVGRKHGLAVVAMQGRVHAYEGNSVDRVVFPLRTMWQLGARTLVVTNAAGGVNRGYRPGDLMLISDHINLSGLNPLVGENDARFGDRFPDMSDAYTSRLRSRVKDAAARAGIALREGVYVGVMGPSYETPAEIRMFQTLGADAVGMSTVGEVIAARHLGMEIVGVSCITNLAAGLGHEALNHDEVKDTATRVKGQFVGLLDAILVELSGAGLSTPVRS